MPWKVIWENGKYNICSTNLWFLMSLPFSCFSDIIFRFAADRVIIPSFLLYTSSSSSVALGGEDDLGEDFIFSSLDWFPPFHPGVGSCKRPQSPRSDNTANYFFLRPPVWRQQCSNRTPVTLSVEEVKLCKILKHIEKYFIAFRIFKFYWAKLVYS